MAHISREKPAPEEAFPPRPLHGDQLALVLEGLACVMAPSTALYVSSPLTTGRRALRWRRQNGFSSTAVLPADAAHSFRQEVMDANRADAAQFVESLQRRVRQVVIDPTAVEDFPGWTQADYRVFWGQVIQRYAEAAVFREGWHYSSGCAYEFLVACESGVRVLHEDLTELSRGTGRSLIAAAVGEYERVGRSSTFLRGVLAALDGRFAFQDKR